MQKKKSEFLVKRQVLASNVGKQDVYDIVDHWPLFVGTRTLARTVEILDVFRSVLKVEGDIAEFGSHKGANVLYLAKLAELYNVPNDKKVHCFESFEGLQNFSEADGSQDTNAGKYKGDLHLLEDVIDLFGYRQRIQIHQGMIEDTLPAFLESHPDRKFSFIYYDADLYEPCKIVLSLLHEKLSVGGVFAFDEYGLEEWPGETRAVDEFLASTSNYAVERPRITKRPGIILRKMR